MKRFRNTFAPGCYDRYLTADGVLMGLTYGLIDEKRVPPEVMKEVLKIEPNMDDSKPVPHVSRERVEAIGRRWGRGRPGGGGRRPR